MRFHSVIVGIVLAVLAGTASARFCVVHEETGPKTCNCSEQTQAVTICTNSEVLVAAGVRAGLTSVIPGLIVHWTVPVNQTVSTGEPSCLDLALDPYTCCWLAYKFKVCTTYTKHEAGPFIYWKPHVTVTYLGVSLEAGLATGIDC